MFVRVYLSDFLGVVEIVSVGLQDIGIWGAVAKFGAPFTKRTG